MSTVDLPISSSGVLLKDSQTWPDWYKQLQFHASFRGVWSLIDPDAEDTGHISNEPPTPPPTIAQMIAQQDVANQLLYNQRIAVWDAAERTTRGARPI
jgi:hypothetical protein